MARKDSDLLGSIVGGVVAVLGVGAVGYGILSERSRRRASSDSSSSSSSSSSHPSRASSSSDSAPMATLNSTYTIPFWRIVFFPRAINAQIPVEFIMSSLAEESGGNPCAIGNPEQYGPDGNPREMGIFQLYNPDDLKLVGRTGAAMRAYCNPNKVAYRTKDGRNVMGPSQDVIRPLTAEEVAAEGDAVIKKISDSRSRVAHYVTENKITWPTDGKDFWRLIKLWHGLPGLVSTGLHAVTQHLGRAPTSWAEYRHLIQTGTVRCDTGTEAYRGNDGFGHVFDNAESATVNMPGKALA